MDLLERARALAACPLFENLAPAVLIRLAERARTNELTPGDRRTTEDTVWVVARGALAFAMHAGAAAPDGKRARPGSAFGVIRVVRSATAAIDIIAEEPSTLVGLAVEDVRDVLEEDPAALTALAGRLAGLLLDQAP